MVRGLSDVELHGLGVFAVGELHQVDALSKVVLRHLSAGHVVDTGNLIASASNEVVAFEFQRGFLYLLVGNVVDGCEAGEAFLACVEHGAVERIGGVVVVEESHNKE